MQTPSLDLEALPSILALPLQEYFDESHPVQKLWRGCDVVELTLRVAVSLAVADLSRHGDLPADLIKELRHRIEEPTLGKWQGMASALVKCLGPQRSVFQGLRPLVENVLIPLLAGPEQTSLKSPENSLSELRNRLAHGAGLTRKAALGLLKIWEPRFAGVFAQLAWLREVTLVVRGSDGAFCVLRGPSPYAVPFEAPPEAMSALKTAFAHGEEVVALRGSAVISLWPLGAFGAPRNLDPDAPEACDQVPQIFSRRGEVHLDYTPVGSEEVCFAAGNESALAAFLRIFHLTAAEPKDGASKFEVADFNDEICKTAARFLGRTEELEKLRSAVAGALQGAFWLSGPAGIGKSWLVARLEAELLDAPPANTLVLPYRFKAGDSRCQRSIFLNFAIERLKAWDPLHQAEEDEERESEPEQDGKIQKKQQEKHKKPLDELRELLGRLRGNRVIFVLDGFDEVAERDARFASEVPLALLIPNVVWLCAGRPERGLPEAFAAAGATSLFPDGLPGMRTEDIRTMLLENIGTLRKKLVANDREKGDSVVNPFVERVAEYAKGLPLYVAYVIGDVCSNRFRALDAGERLPPSLSKYHEELLKRCSVGVLHQVVTPAVATIAVAREPLTVGALAAILVRRNLIDPSMDNPVALTQRALSAIETMLRRSTAPDGEDGFALYHNSLRQHMAQSPDMASPLGTARKALAEYALSAEKHTGPEMRYLFRHGIAHLVDTGQAAQALRLLCEFEYVMARLRTLQDSEAVQALIDDWQAVASTGVAFDRDARICEAFFREKAHILRRGNAEWPAYKILLQLSVEHADDSPLTICAEKWLAEGRCDWVWLRRNQRPPHAQVNPCLAVLEGHLEPVEGALVLPDGQILSWSGDSTLRLWNSQSGKCLAVLEGHERYLVPVFGGSLNALVLPDDRILSWSWDSTLRLWDSQSGECLAVLKGHSGQVDGALVLPDGRILSWSEDHTLRFWDGQAGRCLAVLEGHSGAVWGLLVLPDGQIISWSGDKTLRLWDSQTDKCLAVLKGHSGRVDGALVLPVGQILSWSGDKTLRLWDGQTDKCLAILKGHSGRVDGALVCTDGRILSWSGDKTLRLWDGQTDKCLAILEGHSGAILGALVLPDGRILSWSEDKTLRLWDAQTGNCLAVLEGHSGAILGALVLPDGRILSWSEDNTLRFWDGQAGKCLVVLEGHSGWVDGALVHPNGRVLSWSDDGTLRLWDSQTREHLENLEGHLKQVDGALVLPDGRILSWSEDRTLRLWDGQTGNCLAVLEGHSGAVWGALVLPDGRILSWSKDRTLRLWDGQTGKCLAVLEGHSGAVWGLLVLPVGQVLSWSGDKTLRLWDGQTGKCLAVLEGHSEWANGALVLSDGRILSWSGDKTLRLWDGKKGKCLAVLEGHSGAVRRALVFPDGRILSRSGDLTLRLWDGQTGKCLAVLEGHSRAVNDALMLPDGRVLSWSEDHTLRLWDGQTSICLAVLEGHSGAVWGALVLPDGRILSWSEDNTLRLWDSNGSPVAVHSVNEALSLFPEFRSVWGGQDLNHSFTRWGRDRNAGRLSYRSVEKDASFEWHGDSRCNARLLTPDGRAVLTQQNGQVCFLQVHHGNRPITIAELETMFCPSK
jgi:WD40 repeat protein